MYEFVLEKKHLHVCLHFRDHNWVQIISTVWFRKIKFFTINSFVVCVNAIHLLRDTKEWIYYFYQRCLRSKRRKKKKCAEWISFLSIHLKTGILIDYLTLHIPLESKSWTRYFDSFDTLKGHFGKSNYTIW